MASGHGACIGVVGVVSGNPLWFCGSVEARISTTKSSYPVVLVADQLNCAVNLIVGWLGSEPHVSPWGAIRLVFKSTRGRSPKHSHIRCRRCADCK